MQTVKEARKARDTFDPAGACPICKKSFNGNCPHSIVEVHEHLEQAVVTSIAREAIGQVGKKTCSLPLVSCPTHGYIHGAEAEELRSEIEKLIAGVPQDICAEALQALLDRVDARDSCAFAEAFGFARGRK